MAKRIRNGLTIAILACILLLPYISNAQEELDVTVAPSTKECAFINSSPRYYSVKAGARITGGLNSPFVNDGLLRTLRRELDVEECQLAITVGEECTAEAAVLPCLDPYYVCGEDMLTISSGLFEAASSGDCDNATNSSSPLCDTISKYPEIAVAVASGSCKPSCFGTEIVEVKSSNTTCFIYDIKAVYPTQAEADVALLQITDADTIQIIQDALSEFDPSDAMDIVINASANEVVGFGFFPPPPSPPPPPPSPPPPPPPLVSFTGVSDSPTSALANGTLPVVDDATLIMGNWSQCSASCGEGIETRSISCVAPGGAVLQLEQCGADSLAATYRPCSGPSCSSPHWEYSAWSDCSASCGGGVATRNAMCVGASTGSTCREEKQATEIACNTAPCDPHYWQTGAWTECSAACDGGEITRTVQCVSLNGQPAGDEVCGAIAKPAASQICNAQPCDFCANNNCSGHGSCTDGACVCGEGFTGMHCQAPASCTSAIVDAAMICCASGTVNTKGECCPSGTVLDASGGCCASWAIDGCGVCGGEGKLVDMLGGCCATMLDSSGLCCVSGEVDECGVCDGLGNTCTLDITMQIAVSKDALMGTAVLEEPLRDFLGELAATLNVDPSGVDVYALELVDSTNTTTTTGGGRRLAQSSSSSLDTTDTSGRVRMDIAFKIPPESLKGETSSPSVSAAIASMAATQSPDSLVLIASSPTTSRMGVCGNRVCEIGEDSTACPSDCPFTGSSCTQGCSSGVCMPASGACECYPGYTGPDCSTCGSGYISNVQGGCSADVFMMGTVEANSVITNPSVTDGSTGSGDSTSTVVDESVLAEQEGGNGDGVSASSVDGATSSSTTTTGDDSSSGTNVGAIVGGLLGALAAVAVGLAVFVYIRRKRQNSDGNNGNSSRTMMSSGENGDVESHGVIDVALRSKYGGDPTSSQYGGNNSNKSSKDFGAGGVMGGFQPTAGSARQYSPTAGGASSSARNQRLAQSTGDLPRDLAVMRASTSSLPAYISSVSTRYADCVDGEEEEDDMVMMMDEEIADIELNYDDNETMPPPPPKFGSQAPISARLTVAEIRGAVAALDKEEGEEHIDALRAAVDALETTSGRRSGRDGVVGSTEQQQQQESSEDTTTSRGSVSSMSSGGRRPAGVPLLDLNTLQSTKSKKKRTAGAGAAVTVAASNKEWEAKLSAHGMGTPQSWRDDAGLQRTAAAGALHNSVEGALLPEVAIEGMQQQEAVQQLQHEPRESIVARYFNTPRGQLLRTLAAEATAALKGKPTMINTTAAAADGVENVILVGGGVGGRRSKSFHASPTKTLNQLAALSEKIQSAENSPAKGRKVLWR